VTILPIIGTEKAFTLKTRGTIVKSTTVSGRTIKSTAEAFTLSLVVYLTMASGKTIKCTAEAFTMSLVV